jgi:hypothetical protein
MKCPNCNVNAIKYGKTKNKFRFEKQRYICKYCNITFNNELEENFIAVYIFDMITNLEDDFKNFYKLLLNEEIDRKDFKDLMQKVLKVFIHNNLSLKIIYYLFNQNDLSTLKHT